MNKVEKCQRCNKKYSTVYRAIPDDLWEQVTGHSDGSGLLCPKCFSELAHLKDIDLYWEVAEGDYPTEQE